MFLNTQATYCPSKNTDFFLDNPTSRFELSTLRSANW